MREREVRGKANIHPHLNPPRQGGGDEFNGFQVIDKRGPFVEN
jgi:hypothetical protein